MARVKLATINPERLSQLRGQRSREVIAHELRRRGHGTDAKAIWRYETGRNQPSARVLPDYAAVLGAASLEDLYSANGDGETPEDDSESDLLAALDVSMRSYLRGLIREETR